MESITVSIKNWEAYKGRRDVEHNSWFRCSNRLLEDPDFFEFTAEEILVWIYILSLASQKNREVVEVKFAHAERVARLKKSAVFSAIKKLERNQLLPVDVTSTLRPRNADVTSTCATDRQTDKTDREGGVAAEDFNPRKLAELWNEKMAAIQTVTGKPMPMVDLKRMKEGSERWRHATARIAEDSSPEYWQQVIDRISRSEFCRGRNDRGWIADFDFLVAPDRHAKVMEGKYDARVSHKNAPPSTRYPDVSTVPAPPPPEARDGGPEAANRIREIIEQKFKYKPA